MIRLGVAQSPAALGGQDDRFAWLEHLLDRGACDELDAVLLPELFQCGYSLDGVLSTLINFSLGSLSTRILAVIIALIIY